MMLDVLLLNVKFRFVHRDALTIEEVEGSGKRSCTIGFARDGYYWFPT